MRAEGRELVVFWYNPNIQPYREYRRRLGALKELAARDKYYLVVDDFYDPDYFFRKVARAREGRCPYCYVDRLGRAAARARELGCDAFTTTLLISARQDQAAIAAAGEHAAAETGVPFLARDFRALDDESHRLARDMGLYLQGYCGCLYSEEERYR